MAGRSTQKSTKQKTTTKARERKKSATSVQRARPKAKPAARARRAAGKPRAVELKPAIFISYRHSDPSAQIAGKLYEALLPAAETWGADLFMDQHALEPADLFDSKIIAGLDRTTHFIALLNNSYWNSDYCRKEIARVIERFEKDRSVRPLFVKEQEFNLQHFTFDKDRRVGRIKTVDPLVIRVGDLQFLGPFNRAGQLERLAWENEARLSDQLAKLVDELQRVVR